MKKLLSIIAAVSVLAVSANAQPLYTESKEEIVTGGVTLKNEKRFYGDYALNISCVSADLNNDNIGFELLKHSGGSDKTATVMNFAKEEEDTAVAINGDFFSVYKGDQNFSLGLEVKDGELLQSHINPDMAAGFFDGEVLSFSYVDFSAEIEAPDGTKMPVAHINKPTDYYGAVLMYTPEFNGSVSPFLPNGITALTVQDDTVTAKGVSLGGTIAIPENGYILVIDDNMTPFLEYKFNVGDKVNIKITVDPSLENIQTAFGGGTLLLKDGEKTKITHAVNGNNPRSVIGTDADGTKIYMLTVDGRQTDSRGVTLDVLADICLEMGMKNAINLDGGGSTAMVGKTLENGQLHKFNSPTEDRKVINALAITNEAKPGKAVGAYVVPESEFVLMGDSVNLTLIPYDENYNKPTSFDGKTKWVISKGRGTVKNNVYYADGSGETVLDFYYDGKKVDSCIINVITRVSGITSPSVTELEKGETKSISGSVKIFDPAGNTAVVKNMSLLNPEYDRNFVSLSDDGTVKLLREGAGQITFSYTGAQRSMKVISGKNETDADKPVVSDSMQKYAGGGFSLAFYGSSKIDTLFDRVVFVKAMDELKYKDAVAIVGGEIPSDLTPKDVTPIVADKWDVKKFDNAKVITLSLSSGRLARGEQWKNLSGQLNTAVEDNIFIVTDEPLRFAAELDRMAFHSMVKETAKEKNVFVIYSGEENFCRISDGVRYMTVAGAEDESSLSQAIEHTSYLNFNITADEITYQYRKLYE